jgi:hypothetical protein
MKKALLLFCTAVLSFSVIAQREIKKAPELKDGDGH